MAQLNQIGVRFKIQGLFDEVVETIEETCNDLFVGLGHVCSDHGSFHFFALLFDTLLSLLEHLGVSCRGLGCSGWEQNGLA